MEIKRRKHIGFKTWGELIALNRITDRKGLWLVWVCIAVMAGAPALGQDFERALPGRTFVFPQDHYSHPEFRTEWWYYTGHVQSTGGESFGYQLTFFRTALRREKRGQSEWSLSTIYFAHFALTDKNKKTFRYREMMSRGALGQAGAATDSLHVWVGSWSLKGEGQNHLLEAGDQAMAIKFRLIPLKAPVVNGINGLSQKAEGEGFGSYYYSVTRMKTEGTLTLDGEAMTVEGTSWMDHEFGSNQLQEYQVGWDWFSIQLENMTELMIYRIRHGNGTPDPNSSGTLTYPDGTSTHLRLEDLDVQTLATWTSRKTGTRYPAKWRIRLPQWNIDLTVTPAVSDQELVTHESTRITYWEGSVRVKGLVEGKPVSGVGYVELTGYDKPLDQKI